MIAIGIGCRKGCPAGDILDLVRAASACLPTAAVPDGLFSLEDKRDEPGLAGAAHRLGLPLTFLDRAALRRVAGRAKSRSPRIERMYGLPCVAETAALAGAGEGAVLLVGRLACPGATCAIAGPAVDAGSLA